MNCIKIPITPDGNTGFDEYNQLFSIKGDTGHFITDVRAKICPICSRGWENTTESLQNQIYSHVHNKYMHKSCLEGAVYYQEYNFVYNIVVSSDVNIKGVDIKEIPNEYWDKDKLPWFKMIYFDIPNVEFVIGWRKRVRVVKIIDKNIANYKIEDLFKDEQVTKSLCLDGVNNSFYIHAWSDEDTKEYYVKMVKFARESIKQS